jgi:hypothetical protein
MKELIVVAIALSLGGCMTAAEEQVHWVDSARTRCEQMGYSEPLLAQCTQLEFNNDRIARQNHAVLMTQTGLSLLQMNQRHY